MEIRNKQRENVTWEIDLIKSSVIQMGYIDELTETKRGTSRLYSVTPII